jgi:hypothetical protein
MAINTSKVQANYAVSMLRIANGSDKAVAIRMLENLVKDTPTSDVTNEQARLHSEAIEAYKVLVAVLRDGKLGVTPPWAAAQAATERWLAVT